MMVKPYKKEFDYSYALGAFPTFELLKARAYSVRTVYMEEGFTDRDKLIERCEEYEIGWEVNDKAIRRISNKTNVYVAGVFEKYHDVLSEHHSHIVLVNPSDMGNLGTIIRTALGFGIHDIAVIAPGADIFHPKVVRASMGAVFSLRAEYFLSFEEYRSRYPKQEVFTFMLNGERQLTAQECPKPELFSLVFGNEATGLADSYLTAGTSIFIPQAQEVDSLNLTIAAGIGMFLFTR